MIDLFPCQPDRWLAYLADGWRLACLEDRLPVVELTEWNHGWPVVLLMRDCRLIIEALP